jgi:hypothetical protein
MCNWCEVAPQYRTLAFACSALQEPRVFDSHFYQVTKDLTADEELVRAVIQASLQ